MIGQGCEFDYSGTQAVKTLKEEGYRIVLVNSNPATIMTDPELADATYIEPITPEIVARIIEKERNVVPGGFALLLVGLWVNREQPGLPLAFVGILLNAVAIVTNGGFMPVWEPSLAAAGLTPADVGSVFHQLVGAATDGGIPSDFLAQAGPLGDIIPIPIPVITPLTPYTTKPPTRPIHPNPIPLKINTLPPPSLRSFFLHVVRLFQLIACLLLRDHI